MPLSHNLGFPPLGAARELKRATEAYWKGKIPRDELVATGGWDSAKAAGRLRVEGKAYVVQEGDVLNIRFAV